jgi:hypothetical protein
MIGRVSQALGEELENQNLLLSGMTDRYHRGMDAVAKLIVSMKSLYASSGMSAMTLTMLFVFGVIFFLWIYWKIFA